MSRSLVNASRLAVAVEESFGVLPTPPSWDVIPFTGIRDIGAELKSMEPEEISLDRGRGPGDQVDLDSKIGVDTMFTLSIFRRFVEGFLFATMSQPGSTEVAVFTPTAITASIKASKALDVTGAITEDQTVTIGATVYRWRDTLAQAYDVKIGATVSDSLTNLNHAINATGVAGTHYFAGTLVHPSVSSVKTDADTVTVTALLGGIAGNAIAVAETMANGAWAGGAVFLSGGVDAIVGVAAGGALPAGTLVFLIGLGNTENNGLKLVSSGSDADEIKLVAPEMTAETPPDNALVQVAGVQGGSGDLEIDSDGNLISTTLDFTTLDLVKGQGIGIGDPDTAAYSFATAANNGKARLRLIAANKLTLDRRRTTMVEDDGAGKTIRLFYGPFVRKVRVGQAAVASGGLYIERSFTFEYLYDNLGGIGTDKYEYSVGNMCAGMSLNLPLTNLATCTWDFIGSDAEPPSTTREDEAENALDPVMRRKFSTATDFCRLRGINGDEDGILTDLKTMTLKLNNNLSADKHEGHLGATAMNIGKLHVDIESQWTLLEADILTAVRENTDVGLEFCLRNEDGAAMFDVPAAKATVGKRVITLNEAVRVDITLKPYVDDYFGHELGVTLFPYLPDYQEIVP